MVECVCYTADLVDKRKDQEGIGGVAKDGEETETVNCQQTIAGSAKDLVEALLASLDIAEYLSEESTDSVPTFLVRALANILGSSRIDVAQGRVPAATAKRLL